VVTGIATDSGPDDDDGGYRSPSVAIRTDGGTNVTVAGNDLAGRTSDVAVLTGAAGSGGVLLLNGGVPGVQEASATRVRVGAVDLELPGGSSRPAVFDLGAPAGGAAAYRLHLVARDGGTPGLGEAVLVVSRDRDPAEVVMSAVENRIGDGFGTAGSRFRVRATVSADAARLTVVVDNTSAGPARVGLELM
jgi:hypothetical protein